MADFTPTPGNYTELKPFRYWCQKVLPLVYDDSLSYYELLCKVVDYLNKTMEDVETLHDDVLNLHTAYVQLQDYVNEYFDNLDVQEEINNKLDTMAQNGSLSALISPFIPDIVTDWLDENIDPTTPPIDASLTVEGAGADAKKTGELACAPFNASNLYTVGMHVLYNGGVYRCIEDITTAAAWDATKWKKVNFGDSLSIVEDMTKGFSTYKAKNVFMPQNLLDKSECYDNIYLVAETGALYASTTYISTGFIKVEIGKTIIHYTVSNGSLEQTYMGAVVAYDANFSPLANRGARNVTSYTPESDTKYVRISLNKQHLSENGDAIYQVDAGYGYTVLDILNNNFAVLSEIVTDLKSCVPIASGGISFTESDGNMTVAVNQRFLSSDNTLIQCVDSITFEFPTAITGVAINSSGKLVAAIPTIKYHSKPLYYIAIWYNKKLIFDPCNINERDATNGFISGSVIAWISNSKLYIYASSNTRFMYNGLSQSDFNTAIAAAPVSVSLDTTSQIRYVYYNGSLNAGLTPPKNAYILGYTVYERFTAIDKRIITNRLPILDIVQRTDVPTYVCFERLGYKVVQNTQDANDNYYAFFGSSARLTNSYSKTLGLMDDDKVVNYFNYTKTHNEESIANKKILTVGDSITKRGWYQNYIKTAESSVDFVGTQDTNNYSLKCEGYSGQSMSYVFGSSGPFWNASTGKIDFYNYCTTNNIHPNIVICMFGLNETETPQEYFNYLQAFIDEVKDYSESIDVYIGIPFGECGEAWYGTGAIAFGRFANMELYQCQCYGLSDCTLIPCYYVIDDNTDYSKHEVSYGVGDLSFNIVNDGVHPDETTGFKKLANIIYNYLA